MDKRVIKQVQENINRTIQLVSIWVFTLKSFQRGCMTENFHKMLDEEEEAQTPLIPVHTSPL